LKEMRASDGSGMVKKREEESDVEAADETDVCAARRGNRCRLSERGPNGQGRTRWSGRRLDIWIPTASPALSRRGQGREVERSPAIERGRKNMAPGRAKRSFISSPTRGWGLERISRAGVTVVRKAGVNSKSGEELALLGRAVKSSAVSLQTANDHEPPHDLHDIQGLLRCHHPVYEIQDSPLTRLDPPSSLLSSSFYRLLSFSPSPPPRSLNPKSPP
jgi:hypothetical protein